jgi:hypothetical protein
MANDYLPNSGMTPAHFEVFRSVAKQLQQIILVRDTNTQSTYWIGRGYPSKPKELEALKTSPYTGVVTAKNRFEKEEALSKGFYIVDDDGFARRGGGWKLPDSFDKPVATNPLTLPNSTRNLTTDIQSSCRLQGPFRWPGQVIHPLKLLPIVGDYDLMGVFSPQSKGSNVSLVASNGIPVKNRTNPRVAEVSSAINARLDQPRILHGPQDMYKSFRGSCTLFLEDGSAQSLSESGVKKYYESINRQTSTGSYR